MRWLFLLFTIVPLVDLWVLTKIGGRIGFVPTVVLVVLTGVVGAALAKAEGFRVLRSWQAALATGRMPEEGVVSAALVLMGAALLVAPGVITDVIGLAFLFPPTRRVVAAFVRRRMAQQIASGRVRVVRFPPGGAPGEEWRWQPPRPAEEDADVVDVTPPRSGGRLDP